MESQFSQNHGHRILSAYATAVNYKDVGGFMGLYASDVHVYDAWGCFEYEGSAAWRTMVEGWFGSLGAETVRVDFADVRVCGGPEVAIVSAAATFTAYSGSGVKQRSLTNRFTMGLSLRASQWLIAHEHSSLPVDIETGRGIFGS